MRAKYARLIRIGIMARCVPYTKVVDPLNTNEVYEVIAYKRLQTFQRDWFANSHNPLVSEAYMRTAEWKSERGD